MLFLPFGRYFLGLKLYTILLLSIPYYPSSSTNHRLKLRSSLLNSAPLYSSAASDVYKRQIRQPLVV